ncbi:MAG: WD40-repeat-containing domain protein [Linnemannia gamsii]|nr:MAG: WD40-repeat-containing domain protein [Linnemannia gamsii]
MPLLPFSHIIRHPAKDIVVLSFGEHLQAVDTKNGGILASTIALEEREANGLEVQPLTNTPDEAQNNKARVQVMAFSPDGAFLATAADDKIMKIWDTESWKVLGTRTLVRRSNALHFNNSGSHVITADKFGDVYNMIRDIPDVIAPVKAADATEDAEVDEDEGEQPILGHVSMATDLVLTADNKYVITADRDEHIRVSQYPKGHNIETYCLGHTSFVTSIRILPGASQKYLISGAGDATIRVWEFMQGREVQTFNIREALGMPPAEADIEDDVTVFSFAICPTKSHIAAVIEKESRLLILQWNEAEAKLELFKILELEGKPLSADYDRSGNLWTSVLPSEDKPNTNLISVYNNDYAVQEDLAKYVNTFGSRTVDTLPELIFTEELRKHTTDWRELKKAREEKEAARLAGDPDAPLSKKRRKNKNSRKIPDASNASSTADSSAAVSADPSAAASPDVAME